MSDDSPITGDTPFRVGDWHVDPATGRVKSGTSEVKLEPKVMAVLVCLAQQPGKVVTREQLEATVWAGVVVGYDSLASTIIKLRKAFGDDSKQPRIIETVPKRGYRLIAGVGPVQREAGVVRDEKPQAPPTTWVVTGLVTALLLLGVAVWLYIGSRQPVPDPGAGQAGPGPSIAVLPFKNISNDPGQDYFSDGITADLITDLSQISGLSVIARNSVFAYKDTDVDVRQIGRELGVLYVLEGSIRKVGDKVCISARLSDTGSGYNLWAERFDSALSDVANHRLGEPGMVSQQLYQAFLHLLWVEHSAFIALLLSGAAMAGLHGWFGQTWLTVKLLLVLAVVLPLELLDIWLGHVRLPRLFHHRHPSRPYSAQESALLALYHGRLTRIALWVMPVAVTVIIWLAVGKAW
jgi:TolB-like protein/DNA-binding winged helix-turn-helix (wHTH) protein